jgi:hypothetical protein
MKLQIKECTGFTKEEAFQELNFHPCHAAIPGTNCTQAWTKAGSPVPGTKDFSIFAAEQLAEKTKNTPGLGLYVVLSPPVKDTRIRPYKIYNNIVESTREWTFNYMIVEANISMETFPEIDTTDDGDIIKTYYEEPDIVEYGKIIKFVDNKAEALSEIKRLTAKNHKDYAIMAVKVPDIVPIAGYSIYTPSAGTCVGKYIAFGFDKED